MRHCLCEHLPLLRVSPDNAGMFESGCTGPNRTAFKPVAASPTAARYRRTSPFSERCARPHARTGRNSCAEAKVGPCRRPRRQGAGARTALRHRWRPHRHPRYKVSQRCSHNARPAIEREGGVAARVWMPHCTPTTVVIPTVSILTYRHMSHGSSSGSRSAPRAGSAFAIGPRPLCHACLDGQ
jgi:hypothetical protein